MHVSSGEGPLRLSVNPFVAGYDQITLFLPRRLVGGLLLDRCYRFFGRYKNHFRYHQDGEKRHKHKNVSAKSAQVEVFHGLVIGRNNPDK